MGTHTRDGFKVRVKGGLLSSNPFGRRPREVKPRFGTKLLVLCRGLGVCAPKRPCTSL